MNFYTHAAQAGNLEVAFLKAFYSNPALCLRVHESQWPSEWHERPLVVNMRS